MEGGIFWTKYLMSHSLVLAHRDPLQTFYLFVPLPSMPARVPGAPGKWAEQHINRSQGWEQGGTGAIHLLMVGQATRTPQTERGRPAK